METNIETIKKLQAVPEMKWFSVTNGKGEDMTELIKELIDSREQLEFSHDYKRFRRLPNLFLTL